MQPTGRRIVVLGMGGTIAGVAADAHDNLGYVAGARTVDQLLAGIEAGGFELEAETVARIDSKNLAWDDLRRLVARVAHHLARAEVRGVLVTHGTDTLEESAYVLSRTLGGAKPVVLTGAMRPASSAQADGPGNLRDALAVAGDARARGVLAAFAGRVHAGACVRKVHPYRLDAFGSGEAGPLAAVEEGAVRWWHEAPVDPSPIDPRALDAAPWPWIEIVTGGAGSDPRAVQALVDAGVEGLVLAAPGNGSVHAVLAPVLDAARGRGVDVWRATRCGDGCVLPAPDEPLPHAGALTPVQARLELALRRLAARA